MTTVEIVSSGPTSSQYADPQEKSSQTALQSPYLSSPKVLKSQSGALMHDLVRQYMGEPNSHGSSQEHLSAIDSHFETLLSGYARADGDFDIRENLESSQSPLCIRTAEEVKLHLALSAVCSQTINTSSEASGEPENFCTPCNSFLSQIFYSINQLLKSASNKGVANLIQDGSKQAPFILESQASGSETADLKTSESIPKRQKRGEVETEALSPIIISVDVPDLSNREAKVYTIPYAKMGDLKDVSKTHSDQRISGAHNKCWMRAAWGAILAQMPTRELDQKLIDLQVSPELRAPIRELSIHAQKAPLSIFTGEGGIKEIEEVLLKVTGELLEQHIEKTIENDKTKDRELSSLGKSINRNQMGKDDYIYTLMHILGADVVIDSRHEKSFKILHQSSTKFSGMVDNNFDQKSLGAWLSTKPIILHDTSGVHFSLQLPATDH